MTKSEKQQRVLRQDGKVFEIKVLVEETYLIPKYRLVKQETSVLGSTGLLVVFELQPVSGEGPSFVARWDEGGREEGKQRNDLDVDI